MMSKMASQTQRFTTTPIPDPTTLTTDQLRRELAALRDTVETRLDAMDKAAQLFHENLTRVPTDTDKQISHLKELHEERFASIQTQFDERDVRSAASEDAAKVAVDAALQAQKEAAAAQNASNAAAITKSEAATVKQIDGILALLTSNSTALSDKIAVINGRLDRSEGVARNRAANTTTVIAVAAVIATLVGVAAMSLNGHQPSVPQIQVAPPPLVTAPPH
jgi:hypothetical protein